QGNNNSAPDMSPLFCNASCAFLRRACGADSLTPLTSCADHGRILLVNLLQRSRRTFSWESFLSFFAFKEGMVDTQISALGDWPTVSGRFADGQRKDVVALAFGSLPHVTCVRIGDGALPGSSSQNTCAKQSKQILWL